MVDRVDEIRALRDIERTGDPRAGRSIPAPVQDVLSKLKPDEVREFAKMRADALQRELSDHSFF
jgi:hypothetical protein